MTEILKEINPSDWDEFKRINNEIMKKTGRPILDIKTLELIQGIKTNPEKYECRLPDDVINRTDGKSWIVDLITNKATLVDDEEYDRSLEEKLEKEMREKDAERQRLLDEKANALAKSICEEVSEN